jgi:hypothetical protein
MTTTSSAALRKANSTATKPVVARSKVVSKKAEEPLPDLSHLSAMEQLIEAFKDVPSHKIKLWPIQK